MKASLTTRLVVLVSPEMASQIEEKRWALRMHNTSDTVREMIARGLTVELDGPLTDPACSAPTRGRTELRGRPGQ